MFLRTQGFCSALVFCFAAAISAAQAPATQAQTVTTPQGKAPTAPDAPGGAGCAGER